MNMSFESASLDAIRWERRELKKADALYWAGKDTGLTDKEYDEMAEDTGHICKPPETLKGWAQYPDQALMYPNRGLKKVSYEIASKAVKHWPKWDGIFIQYWPGHFVTRGDGRIGKDLAGFFKLLRLAFRDKWPHNFELCYTVKDGGRVALCRDLALGKLSANADLIPHLKGSFDGEPPRAIPDQIEGWPVDGWVVEMPDGNKYAYKGGSYE